jgi:hypothetical protein
VNETIFKVKMKDFPDEMKEYLQRLGMKQVPQMNENSFHFIHGS